MFCNNCGKQNPDGAKFCNSCGANLFTASQNTVDEIQNERHKLRNAEIAEIERMIRYFSKQTTLYDKYDRLSAQIDNFSKGKHYALLVWGIIVSFLGMITTSALSGEQAGALAGVIPFLIGQGMIIGHIVYAVSFDKRKNEFEARINQVTSELLDYYNDYGMCAVGAEYTNPSNLAAIANTIKIGRADTIKEAINILIDDAYKNNMQSLAAQTARNSAAAARAAKAGVFFNAANFFTRR